MRRSSWILGSIAAAMVAACGPREPSTTGGAGAETGAGTGAMTDTTSMAPGATPTDTAMTHDTGAAADTSTPR